MTNDEIMRRYPGQWIGEPPAQTGGTCPLCGGALMLTTESNGKRSLMCVNECDDGAILRAGSLVAADLLEEVPLKASGHVPNPAHSTGNPSRVRELEAANRA